MQVLSSLPTAPVLSSCAMTIGTFDGVHCGHAQLLQELQREGETRALPAVVLTFADMPYCYFRPDDCPRLLTLPDEKIAAMRNFNLDYLLIVPFNAEIAQRSAPDFVQDVLVHKLGLKHLVIGPDFALGKNREGDSAALRELGKQHDFSVRVLADKLHEKQEPISSTRVRGCVESGDVAQAARMLGHHFSLSANVVTGQQLGRTIGVPTINIEPHPRKVLPAHGVYAVRAYLDEDSTPKPAALNFGTRPTVNGIAPVMEFHVIEETMEHTPQRARIEFIERLRDERKFNGLPELVEQLQRDIARAGSLLQVL